jgi:hypothetical protein
MSGTCQTLREGWNGSCHTVKDDARKANHPNEDYTCTTLTSYIPCNENMCFIYKTNICTHRSSCTVVYTVFAYVYFVNKTYVSVLLYLIEQCGR